MDTEPIALVSFSENTVCFTDFSKENHGKGLLWSSGGHGRIGSIGALFSFYHSIGWMGLTLVLRCSNRGDLVESLLKRQLEIKIQVIFFRVMGEY